MRRVQHKTDGNQSAIVEALESIGVQVIDLSAAGDGVPDLAALFRGRTEWLEVKNLDGRGKKLTIPQIRFHEKMRLAGVKVHIVTSVAEALGIFGARLAA